MDTRESKIDAVKAKIADHPDFPKPGILFRDIFPVLRNPKEFKLLIDVMTEFIKENFSDVEVIVGLESRGFLFGPILALNLGASFVPIRKKGKLPGQLAQVSYTLEYGTDCFEIQQDAIKEGQKVIIVDDLLATGGTMSAAIKLIENIKGVVQTGLVVIELSDLKGRAKSDRPIKSLIQY